MDQNDVDQSAAKQFPPGHGGTLKAYSQLIPCNIPTQGLEQT